MKSKFPLVVFISSLALMWSLYSRAQDASELGKPPHLIKNSATQKPKTIENNSKAKPAPVHKDRISSLLRLVAEFQVPEKKSEIESPLSGSQSSATVGETQLTKPATSTSDTAFRAPSITKKIKEQNYTPPKSYWEIAYKTLNAANLNALENYGAGLDYTIQAWDRLFISYYLNPDISIGLIGQYYHTWFQDQDRPQSSTNPGLTQSYASYIGDTGLSFTDKKIASLFGGLTLSGQEVFYFPTSQSSETAGMYGQSRTSIGLAKSIGKLDLKWNEALWYDFQQYETNAYISNSGAPIMNPQYFIFSNIDIGYNFTSKLSFTLESGFINESNYGDSYNGVAGVHNDYLELNPELDYAFSKHFSLGLGIWEVYNTTNQPTDNGQTVSYYTPFAPYNGTAPGSWTSSQVYLLGSVTF
jgi:hypothetical protein